MRDCVIIGGGVVGLSLAYELARHEWQVQVLDRGEFGREASWAGAGILPPANLATAVHPLDQLRGLSHRLHAEWAATLQRATGIDTGYRRCGGVYLARSAGEAAALAGLAETFRVQQIACERLTPGALAAWEPALAALAAGDALRAAYRVPDEAQLRNPRHLQALVAACRQRGVQLAGHAEVQRWEVAGGRLRQVHTTRGPFAAARFCLAGGAWTGTLLRELAIPAGIHPVRGQMVLFRCGQPPFRHVINEGPRYLVARDDGHVLAGSSEEEAGFDKRTTAAVLQDLKQFAWDLVPALRRAEVADAWAGLRPGSADGLPYLGPVPGVENLFVAAGHFRSGLHLSPGTAVVMGQVLRGATPQVDLWPFRVARG